MGVGRRTALALAGASAAAAGLGAAWWRQATQVDLSPAETAFWASRFDDPAGAAVQAQAFRGKPLLLNFWATWCPPCIEELPLLNAFYTTHQALGWQVLGLAVDQPQPVQGFLQRLPLGFPVGVAGLAGAQLSRSLGNPTGGLPYTVVFGPQGGVLHRKIGKVSQAELDQWVQLV